MLLSFASISPPGTGSAFFSTTTTVTVESAYPSLYLLFPAASALTTTSYVPSGVFAAIVSVLLTALKLKYSTSLDPFFWLTSSYVTLPCAFAAAASVLFCALVLTVVPQLWFAYVTGLLAFLTVTFAVAVFEPAS